MKNHKTIKIQMNAAAKFRWWAQKRETPAPKATIDARKFSIAPTGDAQHVFISRYIIQMYK